MPCQLTQLVQRRQRYAHPALNQQCRFTGGAGVSNRAYAVAELEKMDKEHQLHKDIPKDLELQPVLRIRTKNL